MSGIYRGPNSSVAAQFVNADGDKGDIVVSNSGALWTIDAGVVDDSKVSTITAAKITNTASGNLTSTNVQDALVELQLDIDSRVLGTALSDHISDASDAHDASAISNIPSGNLASTDVQSALNELQGDIDTNTSALALKVAKTSSTGSAVLPTGTTGERDGSPVAGYIRYNSSTNSFEGYGTAWGSLGGSDSAGADIASASTVNLTTATGNTVRITGTTAITAFTMNAGQQMELISVGALPLTYNATTMNINGGASYTCSAGDRLSVFKDGAGVIQVNVTKQDGTAVVGATLSYLTDAEYKTGTDTTKILNAAVARANNLVSGTAVTTTSGTSIDFTGIPSWAKRITVMFDGVSTNGTSDLIIQIGDSGGIEVTGYLGGTGETANTGSGTTLFTTGIGVSRGTTTATVRHGNVYLTKITGTTWTASVSTSRSDATVAYSGGSSKTLSATLDRVRITTVNGTDTFDAGSINIIYE